MRRYLSMTIVAVTIVALAILLGYIVGYTNETREIGAPETKTDTIVKVDTVFVHHHHTDTVFDTRWKKYPVHDTSLIVLHDSVFVILPYESHRYSMPDTLDLWYSGIDARVDSLMLYMRTTVVNNTTSVSQTKRLNKIGVEAGIKDVSLMYIRDVGRVSFGFSAGYTYDKEATARGFLGWNF